MAVNTVSDMKRLDMLMRSVYGRTLDEVIEDSNRRGYARGYDEGFKQGYKQGIKNGKRLAKGKPEWPKQRGAPKILDHDILVLQFIEFVDDRMRKEGITLPAAVSRCRYLSGRSKELEFPNLRSGKDGQQQLMNLYKRAKKPDAISDAVRRAYGRLKREKYWGNFCFDLCSINRLHREVVWVI